jgi:DNA-binding MarR family transcriptional regulator
MAHSSLDDLIINEGYSMPEIKTLISLQRRLDINNRIKAFKQADLAEEIDSSQFNVSRALKRLEKDGVIIRNGLGYYFSEKYIKYPCDEKPKNCD